MEASAQSNVLLPLPLLGVIPSSLSSPCSCSVISNPLSVHGEDRMTGNMLAAVLSVQLPKVPTADGSAAL